MEFVETVGWRTGVALRVRGVDRCSDMSGSTMERATKSESGNGNSNAFAGC